MELHDNYKSVYMKQKSQSDDILNKSSKRNSIHKEDKCILSNIRSNLVVIVTMVILCIIVPSWDVYSDTAVTINLFLNGDIFYGLSMLIPQFLNIIFTLITWNKLEKKNCKHWSWILVLLQCWPQFYIARIILVIIKGRISHKFVHKK